MIARVRKSIEEKDKGFTLIELLVVMIIIGILAAIAIPVFLSQRKKAQDTAAVSDVSTLGKEVATYYVDADTALAAGTLMASGRYTVGTSDAGKQSNGVTAADLSYPATATDVVSKSQNWCVKVTYTGGTKTAVVYSAKNGLDKSATAACPA
ncbi:type II secretion system protein [Cellulomonas edaphi]|uniref:Prepilin-type N-terminal cleavage/methylation domain-containing protein n=1 Tax=Cellulomonas edaphi TaxID=3053468 RepID=A0ABT7S6I5_9CELL|nr:prepilin-type N-terminal cleavage/methylation domain-containing protein [Cellulomons edaphi]MDM7831228.1 prepilin-type N-terminal cleavage/methylation domain-containing protein [Cellulomons edaphi]